MKKGSNMTIQQNLLQQLSISLELCFECTALTPITKLFKTFSCGKRLWVAKELVKNPLLIFLIATHASCASHSITNSFHCNSRTMRLPLHSQLSILNQSSTQRPHVFGTSGHMWAMGAHLFI